MEKNVYHDHLDVCAQCEKSPFNLCSVGAAALKKVALEAIGQLGPLHFVEDRTPAQKAGDGDSK